jgi:hypothetical protein
MTIGGFAGAVSEVWRIVTSSSESPFAAGAGEPEPTGDSENTLLSFVAPPKSESVRGTEGVPGSA